MIYKDYEKSAAFWRTGRTARTVTVQVPAKDRFRNGWTGNAFEWNPFCINTLKISGERFLRGWGFWCAGSLDARITLPEPADIFTAQVGINDSNDLNSKRWTARFELLLPDGTALADVTVQTGEKKEFSAGLGGTTAFILRMTEVNGCACPVDFLEPVITYSSGKQDFPGERGNQIADTALKFDYDGKPFDPDQWEHSLKQEGERNYFHRWFSPDGKVELRVEARIHEDFHTIEWIPTLKNISSETSELIENFQSLVFTKTIYDLPHHGVGNYRENAPLLQPEVILHRNYGTRATGTDFLPSSLRLAGRHGMNEVILDTDEGRSSAAWLPFFEIELFEERRIDFAIGWSGAWKSRIAFTSADTFEVTAGLRRTHFKLFAGEEIRQPSIIMHYMQGSQKDCRNEFRRFMVAHRLPRNSKGELLYPPISSMFSGSMPNDMLKKYAELFRRKGLPVEVIWVDAGWYGADREVPLELHQSDWETTVGDWRVNQIPHPGGFRPVTDYLHQTGRRFLLWVEMERAVASTDIVREHPEYFIETGGDNRMLDLGNDDACDYAIETISTLIREQGMDCYREDFNFNTIPYWDAADTAERIGMAESRFITGFYRFWGTLRKRFPDLLIDNCASGGRRIDPETLSLSVPLWRSDFQCFVDIPFLPEANQVHFDGMSGWLPLHSCGTAIRVKDDYAFLSGALGTSLVDLCNRRHFDPEDDAFDFEWLKRMLEIAKRMRSFLTGDYYRLTECPEDFRNAYAFELFDEKCQAGYVGVFRREYTPAEEVEVRLHRIDPTARYRAEYIPGGTQEISGAELQKQFFKLPRPRSCQLLFFEKV